jgi:hypothetical protein
MRCSSVIVGDLNVAGVIVAPNEADAILVVDANAVLAFTISAERLKPIPGRDLQVSDSRGSIEHLEFLQRRFPETSRDAPGAFLVPQPLGVSIAETLDHAVGY